MNNELKSYFKLHFIVLIWGFTAILGLLIAIPAVEVVFYRTLLATAVLGILLAARRKQFAIGKYEIIKIVATGFIIAAHWILFFGAARVSTASVCLAGIATCSFWTSLIEPLMTNRKVKIYEVILGIVVMFGLYVIFRFEFQYALGITMAIISAMLASVFTVLNGKFTHRHNPYTITFYEMLGAFIGTAIFIPVYATYFSNTAFDLMPSGSDWFYLVILAGICTVYAFSASVKIQQVLSAFVVNLTVNLEPVYGIIIAFLIFGEKEEMSTGFYMGTFIILLSVLSYPLVNKLANRKALQSDTLR
ncbi:DMT family transporter [Marivirga sp. S37H4]|uniref:DMT family transporter n=1 Tax=Marivirga aurantiaca TaxID=2802615 RepID=A0A934WWB8_9BACT|nr:DMT family transporter [Marivirga aurantiaca]MBK6264035.1 DMT family transporter [Marivirga aurantiaca]